MSLRVELLDLSERRAGLAALVRSAIRMGIVALGAGILLLIFISSIQLWQKHNHVTTLERTWEMIEDRGDQTDMTIRQLRHMEQTHAELTSWEHPATSSAALLKALCIYTPTNVQITVASILPLDLGKDAPKQKYPGIQSRQFTIRIDGIVTPPAPNRTISQLVDTLLNAPGTSNLIAEAKIDNYDANFKTKNDDSDYTFSILGRISPRPSP